MATPFTTYKLIVLYMLQNSENALTNSQISEFILDREYTNYFHLQQAISELEETDLLKKQTVSNASYYHITEEGRKTLSYFENEISSDIRREVHDYLKNLGMQVPERILTPADYYETPQGGFCVRCQLIEKNTTLLDLTISAPGKEAARSISRNWAKKSQDIYALMMEELL